MPTEIPFDLTNVFTQGLRQYKRIPTTKLITCMGVVPDANGLQAYEELNLVPAVSSISWPFPQVYVGDEVSLLFDATSIKSLSSNLTVGTPLTVKSYANPENNFTILGSNQWHVASFYSTWVATNGVNVVFKTNKEGYSGSTNLVYGDSFDMQSCCALPGRLMMGGFGSGFWNSTYTSLWNSIKSTIDADVNLSLSLRQNSIAWSSVGGGDMLWPIMVDEMISSHESGSSYATDDNYLYDLIKRNDFGFMPMPWQGTVLCVLPYNTRDCIVYGDNGIAHIFYNSEMNTFGLRKIRDFGILSRSSAVATAYGHFFIDSNNRAAIISNDGNIQDLGYEEWFEGLTNPVLSYDSINNWVYICDEDACFVFSPAGLGEAYEVTTSIANLNGVRYGVVEALSDSGILILTDTIKFRDMGIKSLRSCQFDLEGTSSASAQILTRYNRSAAFESADNVILNQEGVTHHFVSGLEFRILLSAEVNDNFRLTHVNTRWVSSDSRYLRGMALQGGQNAY